MDVLRLLCILGLLWAGTVEAEWFRSTFDVGQKLLWRDTQVRKNLVFVVDNPAHAIYNITIRPKVYDCVEVVLHNLLQQYQNRTRYSLDQVVKVTLDGKPSEVGGRFIVFEVTFFKVPYCKKSVFSVAELAVSYFTVGGSDSSWILVDPTEFKIDRKKVRHKRSEGPVWVSLNEFKGERFIWLKPTQSVYGWSGLALMGGSQIFDGREYLQLVNYESAEYLLYIPGFIAAGPYRTSMIDMEYIETRGLLRYSVRDAAWFLWNFKSAAPCYAEHINMMEMWRSRVPSIPADVPGLVFKIKPVV